MAVERCNTDVSLPTSRQEHDRQVVLTAREYCILTRIPTGIGPVPV